jgi:hypothetical protein
MSTEYSDRKIKEILTKVNGQAKLAEQAITTLAQRDLQFLHSLVFPYLNGIISHGIERARKSTGVKEPAQSSALPKRTMSSKPMPKPAPMSGNTMDNLMKAWAKGFEKDAPAAPSTAAVSKSHLAAMNALIKKK